MTNRGEQNPTQWQGSPLARKPKLTAAPGCGRVSGRRPMPNHEKPITMMPLTRLAEHPGGTAEWVGTRGCDVHAGGRYDVPDLDRRRPT